MIRPARHTRLILSRAGVPYCESDKISDAEREASQRRADARFVRILALAALDGAFPAQAESKAA